MSRPLVYDCQQLADVTPAEVGGKAWNLMRLRERGSIPPFYVITAEALRSAVRPALARAAGLNPQEGAALLRHCIENSPLAPELVTAIEAAHAKCFSPETSVAVRSSSASEDGTVASFAGVHESVVGVAGLSSRLEAVRRVWLSAFSPRAIAYRQRHGFAPLDPSMAVVVQLAVDATRSGVCFTCDPVTGVPDRLVVSSLWGLGEALVSGGFAADTFRIDRETFAIESETAEKHEQLLLDREADGVRRVDLPTEDRRRNSLTQEQLHRVAKAGLDLESEFGQPQDLEFCFDRDDRLVVLQSRPVTGFAASRGARSPAKSLGNHLIWDNSNIIESYSGVTTPMTFSFIRHAYAIVYHCFSEVMGISPRVVQQHRDAFDNMLGLFHGRVYYNLKNWYRLVRMFPGYHYNRRFMESMMGVKQSLVLDDQPSAVGPWRRWLVEFPALLQLFFRSGWNFLRIRKTVARFERHFYRHYDEWSQLDFDALPPHEIKRLYDMMEREMLWNWKAPIINDFYVMVFYGILRTLCVRWCGDETASLQNGLICGEGGLQSDEPAKRLMRLAELARQDKRLEELIRREPLESLPNLVGDDPRFAAFNQEMTRFLKEYGIRCANELKLESYSYQEQPHCVYQIIRRYLAAKKKATGDLAAVQRREQRLRRDAEHRAEKLLSQSRSWLPRAMLFRWVLRNARVGIRNRENMRFARTRIYGILRRMLRSIGHSFSEQGVLDHREDIFYLTIDEVWDFVKGTAVTTDLRGLARVRKAEYERYRTEAVVPEDRFETFGSPYQDQPSTTKEGVDRVDQAKMLSGIGCCPGVASGIVQFVRDPGCQTDWSGEILVADRTDPGWVLIYPAFSGILVQRGSVLSHSVIVAREMGIPTIVGVKGLTERLHSGQRVRMDGATGTIQVLAECSGDSTSST